MKKILTNVLSFNMGIDTAEKSQYVSLHILNEAIFKLKNPNIRTKFKFLVALYPPAIYAFFEVGNFYAANLYDNNTYSFFSTPGSAHFSMGVAT